MSSCDVRRTPMPFSTCGLTSCSPFMRATGVASERPASSSAAGLKFARLPESVRVEVARLIDGLSADPRSQDVRPVVGRPGILRARVGNFRVLFKVGEPAALEALGPGQNRRLGRLEHAVEAAQHGEREDHAAVLGRLVGAAQQVGDAPDEADLVAEAVHYQCPSRRRLEARPRNSSIVNIQQSCGYGKQEAGMRMGCGGPRGGVRRRAPMRSASSSAR